MANGYLIYIIIGAAVALFLFLLIVGGVIFFVMRKRKAKKAAEQSTPLVQESQSASHDLPPAAPSTSWDAPSSNAPVWSEPATQVETPVSSSSYSTPSASYEPTPSYDPTPEPSSPFAASSSSSSPFESEPQPTGPFSSHINTSAPPSQPSYPTSPNMRMETSANMHVEPPTPTPMPSPSASASAAEAPVLDETGVTMDLSSYKKYIEEQLKPKSPGSIVFTSGALEGKTYEVPAEGFFIGRDSHASQVVIPDPRVSKSHLWVGWKNGKVTIVDQESRNGTYLNDTTSTKVTETEIKDGDTVILGEANVASFEFKAVQS